jgi:hypothetical protein
LTAQSGATSNAGRFMSFVCLTTPAIVQDGFNNAGEIFREV